MVTHPDTQCSHNPATSYRLNGKWVNLTFVLGVYGHTNTDIVRTIKKKLQSPRLGSISVNHQIHYYTSFEQSSWDNWDLQTSFPFHFILFFMDNNNYLVRWFPGHLDRLRSTLYLTGSSVQEIRYKENGTMASFIV